MDNAPELVRCSSPITATPDEGRRLAVKRARLGIKFTQLDNESSRRLLAAYIDDQQMLITVSQVLAMNFATNAAENCSGRELR